MLSVQDHVKCTIKNRKKEKNLILWSGMEKEKKFLIRKRGGGGNKEENKKMLYWLI